MQHRYSWAARAARTTRMALAGCALTLLALLLPWAARAQVPAWEGIALGSSSQVNGTSQTRAVATDASGNVFVTGRFIGSVAFGSTVLNSPGTSAELFVAKYLPANGTWAWAQQAGGSSYDEGYGIAVAGTSVYVTGYIYNNTANVSAVTFGSSTPVNGATATLSGDIILAKYTDQGSTAALSWVQVGGGTSDDAGRGVAVSGSSVYVTGTIANTASNTRRVVFGGTGTTAGNVAVAGASTSSSGDLVLVKYTDNGPTATLGWTQVGGGTGIDEGLGVAVSGSSVYVTGDYANNRNNDYQVLFGGGGTTPGSVSVNGAAVFNANGDALLAKYIDNGPTATLGWLQVGGGTGADQGTSVAVSGTSVYVTGSITNSATGTNNVLFGGSGGTPGTSQVYGASATSSNDLLLAKYTDNGSTGSYVWSQVGGGTGDDGGGGVAVRGTSVYVVGRVFASTTNGPAVVFGGGGTTPSAIPLTGASATASADIVLAKYTDNGPTATLGWAQTGGSTGGDVGCAVAVGNAGIYAGGYFAQGTAYAFGAANAAQLEGTTGNRAVLACATDGGGSGSGAWSSVAAAFNGGLATIRSVATDAAGNMFAAGAFTGQVLFGRTVLISAGDQDLFVAKYLPATGIWAWAQRAGGTGGDTGAGIAVSGSSVYITGYITADAANSYAVTFGGPDPANSFSPVRGTSNPASSDLVLAKYTDNGTSATLGWTQVGGGRDFDYGCRVAASGTSVYVAGFITNNTANGNGVVFGGSGATAGTVPVNGASSTLSGDVLLAKYTDNGPTATLGWTQVGGGTGGDNAQGLAVSGSSVYVTGIITNNVNNFAHVIFGGGGTVAGNTQVNGASSYGTLDTDIVLAKYTDNGPTATLGWTQVAGGSGTDQGQGVAVSGTSVYLTGMIYNDRANTFNVLLGGGGTVPGTRSQLGATATLSRDIVLAKYTDNGPSATFNWSQVGGGTGLESGASVAVSGSSVYVVGSLANNTANANAVVFGGSGTSVGTVAVPGLAATTGADALLVKYLDNGSTGSFAWSQLAGGPANEVGYDVAVSGQRVLVGVDVRVGGAFGSLVVMAPTNSLLPVMAYVFDPTLPLATPGAAGMPELNLYPNPTRNGATLTGLRAGTLVRVLDLLGRSVALATADATGSATLALPAGLAAGVYVVRSGTRALGLTVE